MSGPGVVSTLAAPLVRRFRVGEGALLAINLSWLATHRPYGGWTLAVISVVTLALMYAFNDWWDARADVDNPRKDHALARAFLDQRLRFGLALAVAHIAIVVFASWAVDPTCASVVAGVLGVNALYSCALKGVPLVDVAIVGIWGGLFTMILGASGVFLPVAAMTAASHVFQAMGDRSADQRAGLTTTASSQHLTVYALAMCSAILSLALWPTLGLPLALLGLAPVIAGVAIKDSQLAWLASKVAFAIAWLVLLSGGHGG